MMELELDIDQSHLPRVQEVCQCFAVLEDGALAHNLQEQEIEQYYNSNVQKNQLFQNDIRIAKRLQDEEEERMSQATLQLEEQDSEYARRIQEEIQRCAEETRRREEEDEEMAKRLQEEEIDIRRQRLDSSHHGGTSDFPLIEGLAPRQDGACLELGELEQVLRDEELARVLQEDEERRLLAKGPPSSRGPQTSNPRGDFQAAQVAQDEEIARFMQRQERKAQRRPCDLGQGSRQEHRDPGDAHERRSTRERKVEVPRERLDSEGLNSPGEDLSPDCQPPSPNCTTSQPQATRNIAEELDPTFQAKRRDSNPAGQASSGLSTSPSSHSGLHDYTQEPTFVPPTKRQSDKSGRPKSKEKKESCKQQ